MTRKKTATNSQMLRVCGLAETMPCVCAHTAQSNQHAQRSPIETPTLPQKQTENARGTTTDPGRQGSLELAAFWCRWMRTDTPRPSLPGDLHCPPPGPALPRSRGGSTQTRRQRAPRPPGVHPESAWGVRAPGGSGPLVNSAQGAPRLRSRVGQRGPQVSGCGGLWAPQASRTELGQGHGRAWPPHSPVRPPRAAPAGSRAQQSRAHRPSRRGLGPGALPRSRWWDCSRGRA